MKRVFIAILLLCITKISIGSFTGSSDKRSANIYSLKNFNRNFYKTNSPFSLRAGFAFKGLQVTSQKKEINGDVTLNYMMRYEKGNTTYIYPYKHRISIPKFKTPTAPDFR